MAGDSYRPPPPPPPPRARRPPPPPPPPPASRQSRDQRPKRPALADRVTFTGGGTDSYRPGQNSYPQHEFTFSSNVQGPRFPPAQPAQSNGNNSARARREPQSGRGRGRSSRGGNNNNPNNNMRTQHYNVGQDGGALSSQGEDPPRRSWKPPHRRWAHERQFLQHQHTKGPVETLGVTEGVNKFLNPDDLSESEAEMDLEDDDDEEQQRPAPKSVRVEAPGRADGDSVPKWSNPDPYFVLPPPSLEHTGKKLDVVQLIRRAKAQVSEASSGRNAVAENDDFISLGNEPEPAPLDAPTGPRSLLPARPDLRQPSALEGSLNQVAQSHANALASARRNTVPTGLPEKPPLPQYPGTQNKRKHASERATNIIDKWYADPNINAAPWASNSKHNATIDSSDIQDDTEKMTMLLSKEIVDFVETFQPDHRTDSVRNGIVRRIDQALSPLKWLLTDGSIQCFGSFPAGLYLPTADMDLVYVSNRHLRGGPQYLNMNSRRQINNVLRTTARKLEQDGIARDVAIIAKAKVPIIKFKDKLTNIHVDLSFENRTGITAQQTFLKWKTRYGNEMVYLVAFVKQFLVMRGLSDVHTGGLGGFSTICLVVFFLHHFREQHGTQYSPQLYGKQLLGFLDFYGNKFDLARHRLVMDPIALVEKDQIGIDGRAEKPDRLSIQDPNNASNNVSGGSSKVKDIFILFAKAHRDLTKHCATWDPSAASILETVIGGDYSSYYDFRKHIYQFHS